MPNAPTGAGQRRALMTEQEDQPAGGESLAESLDAARDKWHELRAHWLPVLTELGIDWQGGASGLGLVLGDMDRAVEAACARSPRIRAGADAQPSLDQLRSFEWLLLKLESGLSELLTRRRTEGRADPAAERRCAGFRGNLDYFDELFVKRLVDGSGEGMADGMMDGIADGMRNSITDAIGRSPKPPHGTPRSGANGQSQP
jgi:hypothetical protein